MSIAENNRKADEAIEKAVAKFQDSAKGGLDIMSMVMNPSKAVTQFGPAIGGLMEGVQMKNAVVTDLLLQVESLSNEVELLSRG